MYENPVLFPAISNRESWWQIVQLADDDTGDLISLTDNNGNSLYSINLEITAAKPRGHSPGPGFPFYDDYNNPVITGSLANYISILSTGTIQILVPRSIVQSMRSQTYDVFLTLNSITDDDGRQLLIGRLPVLYGGRST